MDTILKQTNTFYINFLCSVHFKCYMNNVMKRLDYVTYVLLFYPVVLDIYCRREPTTVNLTTSNVALLHCLFLRPAENLR